MFSQTHNMRKKHYLQSSPKIKLICSQKLRLDSILQDLNEAFSNDEKHSTEKCQSIILPKCAFRINFFRFSNLTLTINDSFVSSVNVSTGSCWLVKWYSVPELGFSSKHRKTQRERERERERERPSKIFWNYLCFATSKLLFVHSYGLDFFQIIPNWPLWSWKKVFRKLECRKTGHLRSGRQIGSKKSKGVDIFFSHRASSISASLTSFYNFLVDEI